METRLPELLLTLRESKGASLRQVEKATKVSNAYISQLERGEATKPSADKLYALAKYYEVPYQNLLAAAGYIEESEGDTSILNNAFMAYNPTPKEQRMMVNFLKAIRDEPD